MDKKTDTILFRNYLTNEYERGIILDRLKDLQGNKYYALMTEKQFYCVPEYLTKKDDGNE